MKGTTNASNTNIGGTVGSDTKPIKIVNGVATPVTNELQIKLTPNIIANSYGVVVTRYGQLIHVSASAYTHGLTGQHVIFANMPKAKSFGLGVMLSNRAVKGEIYISANSTEIKCDQYDANAPLYGSFTYLTDDP